MTDAVRERYARFAAEEAPGRSEVYAQWAAGVAADDDVCGILARIPVVHRQPPLVFAVSRMLGATVGPYAAWRTFVLAHADELVAECGTHRVQTNEPLRLAPLLPVLSEFDGPLALLEIGAAAGLCLYPDRYSYRVVDAHGTERARIDPHDGPSPVVLTSTVTGPLPVMRMPEIVWRGGIDLAPLDAADPRHRDWLRGLIWPGEEGRDERIVAALDIVAADPPVLFKGDAMARLAELAALAPAEATLVVTTPGVLVYLPWPERAALIAGIRRLGAHWITIDAPGLLRDMWRPPVDPERWPGSVVALDGRVRASADPLGRHWEWRGDAGPDAA